MTVYVVICADPSGQGSECWTHGVYESKATARRVFNRLRDETCLTVRLDTKRIYQSAAQEG